MTVQRSTASVSILRRPHLTYSTRVVFTFARQHVFSGQSPFGVEIGGDGDVALRIR
jgi:hypothetical protein